VVDPDSENEAQWRSCRVTDANAGAASTAYTPGIGRRPDDNEAAVLKALDDRSEPGRGATMPELETLTGIARTTLRAVLDLLNRADLVDFLKIGKAPNGGTKWSYGPTEKGYRVIDTGFAR